MLRQFIGQILFCAVHIFKKSVIINHPLIVITVIVIHPVMSKDRARGIMLQVEFTLSILHYQKEIIPQGLPSRGGGLAGGPQCRLSISRNGYVPCRYFLNVPVDFKIV